MDALHIVLLMLTVAPCKLQRAGYDKTAVRFEGKMRTLQSRLKEADAMHTTALAHAHAAVERHRRERNAAALGLAAVAQQAVSE